MTAFGPFLERLISAALAGSVLAWISPRHISRWSLPFVCIVMTCITAVPVLQEFQGLAMACLGLIGGLLIVTSSAPDVGLQATVIVWFTAMIGVVIGRGAFALALVVVLIGVLVLKSAPRSYK